MLTCLITGADSGIGKATAILPAQEGYHLVLIGKSEEKLKVVKEEIAGKTGLIPPAN